MVVVVVIIVMVAKERSSRLEEVDEGDGDKEGKVFWILIVHNQCDVLTCLTPH